MRGDSLQCREMSRSDRGYGRPLGAEPLLKSSKSSAAMIYGHSSISPLGLPDEVIIDI